MKWTAVVLVLVGLLVVVVGCGDTTTSSSEMTTVSVSTTVATVPDDVTYTIVSEDILPGVKRSLDVELNRKVSEDVLAMIATELENADSNTYERTFICYYLPDMEVDAGAWATTHFDPTLEVEILGLTAEEEEGLLAQPTDESRDVVGVWIDEVWDSVVTIYREDGKVFMENKYSDGSVGVEGLVETSSPDGTRFDFEPDRENGEYFLIGGSGDLQELDAEGVFKTLKKAD